MTILEAIKRNIEIRYNTLHGYNILKYKKDTKSYVVMMHRVFWKEDKKYCETSNEEKAIEGLLIKIYDYR